MKSSGGIGVGTGSRLNCIGVEESACNSGTFKAIFEEDRLCGPLVISAAFGKRPCAPEWRGTGISLVLK